MTNNSRGNKSRKNPALHWRRTKILATLGPASDTDKMIHALIQAGVNVFRLNMSHGDHASHQQLFMRIRELARQQNAQVAILVDLCGPKIRVGRFVHGELTLKQHSSVVIRCSNRPGENNIIPSQYKNLYKDVKPDERILLDDGNIELKVVAVKDKDVICRVIYGGQLKDHKGINLPDSRVSVSSFTPGDKRDAKLAIKLGADFVALSFVRTEKDVLTLKNYMKRNGASIPVIAKIEKPEAVDNIEAIIKVSYGIMIARGDLGIELPAEKVPLIQNKLIALARIRHRPVIVATQMMESMISHARPTRAEVNDVANAALSGADAVMLSAETAVGKYPVRTVKTMDTILREVEINQWLNNRFEDDVKDNLSYEKQTASQPSTRKAIAHAACMLADELKLEGILVPTRSGMTANIISSVRPLAPLLGLSSSLQTCRKLALHWGVVPLSINEVEARDWQIMVNTVCKQCKLAKAGSQVLLVSGINDDPVKNRPVLKIMTV